jgi:hypothetical protein
MSILYDNDGPRFVDGVALECSCCKNGSPKWHNHSIGQVKRAYMRYLQHYGMPSYNSDNWRRIDIEWLNDSDIIDL